MSRHWLLVVFFLLLLKTNTVFSQNTSNKGKDFWVAYSGHIDGKLSRLTLFLSADKATAYNVFMGNTVIATGSIPANTCLPVIIDPNTIDAYIGSNDVIESDKAIHVTTTDNPISLYSVIAYQARTGGTLVLPTNTLGKEYYTYSYQSTTTNGRYAQFTIVAVEDGTEIEITPTQGNTEHAANTTFTKTLNKGQIYQYQARDDLSGSHIKSTSGCKPIAVFSGNTWASFCEQGNGRSASGGDNLYQELFPVTAWGRNFVTAPFYNTIHGNTDIIRVIVSEDNTILTVNGSTTNANGTTLANPYNKGAVITFFSNSANVISGSKPISVAQYQTSQTCNLSNSANVQQGGPYPGDPEITVLNPVEQTLTNITVYSRLDNVVTNINKFFINVIIKTADIPSFRLDGNPVSNFVAINNEYSYAIVDVTNSSQAQHRLSAAGGFSAIAYGYGSVESYAYLAGANIQNFTFQPQNEATGKNVTSGCLGEIIKLKINLPYQATRLDWDVHNGDGVITQNAPTSVATFTDNGITYYTYFYPNDIKYDLPGDYQFKVTATKPAADDCGSTEDLITDFTVDKEPTADFEVEKINCANAPIPFKDKSTSNSDTRTINTWLWDFGDGNTSTEQNPVHKYVRPGIYKVILTATTDSKCAKVSEFQEITINPQPVSDFDVKGLCVDLPVILTEKSTIESSGSIVEWRWNFGDGSAEVKLLNNTSPAHKYAATGDYTISLTTVSNLGCVSEAKTKKVTVIDPQVVDFIMPDFCLADGVARFKNTTKNADGTTTGLTAVWKYDNGNPLATSTGFDGAFAYGATGDYTVTLTVKNADGCEKSTSKTFTVNGAVKDADFDIVKNNVCVSDKIVIKNTSTTFAGKITKIEIYRDYPNETSIYKTIPYPDDSDIEIEYNTFGGTADRSPNIRLIAYSGESCFKSVDKPVTIKPVPQLEFADMPAVCEADGTVLIVQATQKVEEEMPGTGEYAGDGMKADGTFNPKVAGVGHHTITYTFTATNGCTSSISKDIQVYASPVADAGSLVYILAGGEIELPATAEGTNLKYEWSPAAGLSKTNVLRPVASPEKDTEYTLTATTQPDGCATTSKVLVKVLQALTPPNTFTPNGDNVNDTWNIKYLESYPNATVEIFNRNGNRVFFSNGYKAPFDGNYQNGPLPVGVYYYIINPRNGRKTITGPLTIIR
ncbi:PKD domain-containing protein [Pedobacter soli]|uniref:Gliding motility-associated C-terminal domain-containing protein n=1 Tax=Pedobacter soli TaxID=390242 RepID=A0A1G6KHT3_9SPHI|nr:PKD domain-containing protein [Pedobacter soli]SDC29866.1 gliding motility-associated C-terminal domain-containing protein [Pedobacter soli]